MLRDRGRAERARRVREDEQAQAQKQAAAMAIHKAQERAAEVDRRKQRIPAFRSATQAALDRLEACGFQGMSELEVQRRQLRYWPWGEMPTYREKVMGWPVVTVKSEEDDYDGSYRVGTKTVYRTTWLLADGQYLPGFAFEDRIDVNDPDYGFPISPDKEALLIEKGKFSELMGKLDELGR